MSPFTRPFRASIVGRAQFIEDLVAEEVARGVTQYVILGAGGDTFAQRRPELASQLTASTCSARHNATRTAVLSGLSMSPRYPNVAKSQ